MHERQTPERQTRDRLVALARALVERASPEERLLATLVGTPADVALAVEILEAEDDADDDARSRP